MRISLFPRVVSRTTDGVTKPVAARARLSTFGKTNIVSSHSTSTAPSHSTPVSCQNFSSHAIPSSGPSLLFADDIDRPNMQSLSQQPDQQLLAPSSATNSAVLKKQKPKTRVAAKPTLEETTLELSQRRDIFTIYPALTLQDALLQSNPNGSLPNPTISEETLLKLLSHYELSVTEWLALRNAIRADSWSQVREFMRGFDDAAWPGFVLSHTIGTVSTLSDVSDALGVVSVKLPMMWRRDLAKRCFLTLIEKGLYELQAVHLIPHFTKALLDLVQTNQVERKGRDRVLTTYANALVRFADDRARDSGLTLLDWAKTADERQLHQQLCKIFIGIENRATDSYLEPGKRLPTPQPPTASSHTFLDTNMVENVLPWLRSNPIVERRALVKAIQSAVRHVNWSCASEWCDELVSLVAALDGVMSRSEAVALLGAFSIAPKSFQTPLEMVDQTLQHAGITLVTREEGGGNGSSSVKDVQQQQRFHKTDESKYVATLQVMAADTKIPIAHVLQSIGIFESNQPGLENVQYPVPFAIDKVHQWLATSPGPYTAVMHGLNERKNHVESLAVWEAMIQRGIAPSIVTLSCHLQTLFTLGKVHLALKLSKLWCEQGVMVTTLSSGSVGSKPMKPIFYNLSQLSDSNYIPTLSPPPLVRTENTNIERIKLQPNAVFASILLIGLYINQAPVTESIWSSLVTTMQIHPDACVLATLLKCSCHSLPNPSLLSTSESKQIFQSILFSQHPKLKNPNHPLSANNQSWLLKSVDFGVNFRDKFLSNHSSNQHHQHRHHDGDLPTIIFDSNLFQQYFLMLIFERHHKGGKQQHNQVSLSTCNYLQQLVDVLSWMRLLNLKPCKKMVSLVLVELNETIPIIAGDQVLNNFNQWMIGWIGKQQMPTRLEYARVQKWKQACQQGHISWLDFDLYKVIKSRNMYSTM